MIHSLTIQVTDATGVSQGELTVKYDRFDGVHDQYGYRVSVEDLKSHVEELAYGSDLRMPAAVGVEHIEAMKSLLTFLLADGEKYRDGLNWPNYAGNPDTTTSDKALLKRTGDSYLFNERTAEWAYGLSDELAMARDELDGKSAEAILMAERERAAGPDDDDADSGATHESDDPNAVEREERRNATAAAIEATQFMPDDVPVDERRGESGLYANHPDTPDVDPRLSEPEEQRGSGRSYREERFAVQRRYVGEVAERSTLRVGIWGDVVTVGSIEAAKTQFEWGARGGTTDEGVVVQPLARMLKADERLVRVRGRQTVEVIDEELYEPRRVIDIYNGWLIRRYETDGSGGSMPHGGLDAIYLHGVGIAPGHAADELDLLKAWIDGENTDPEPVVGGEATCACERGARERAMYGNVHSDEEEGR